MKPQTVGRSLAPEAHIDQVAGPRLYLSSTSAGWEGLEAEAFLEPNELEGWMTPVIPAVSLVLFRGGGMRIEARQAGGAWSAVSVHDGDLSLRPGWSPPMEVRWTRSVDSRTDVAGTATLHLRIGKELLERTAEDVASFDAAHLSIADRTGFQDPLLAQIGHTLWRELEQPSPAGRLYAQTAAQLLAVHLLRCYTPVGSMIKEPPKGRLTPRQMQRVKEYVQEHLGQSVTLDDLARQTGFSPYHFARLFRRTTGESPHGYVMRLRIERAQRLLERADLSLAEVALATGFAHQSHLTQHFKRHVGLTPRAYQREVAASS